MLHVCDPDKGPTQRQGQTLDKVIESSDEWQWHKTNVVVCAFVPPRARIRSTPELTLDDLRKLEIICFVPSHPPEGFRLQRVDITYDELHEELDDMKHQLPLNSIVYSNDPRRGATFSIESAREGIGERTPRSLVHW